MLPKPKIQNSCNQSISVNSFWIIDFLIIYVAADIDDATIICYALVSLRNTISARNLSSILKRWEKVGELVGALAPEPFLTTSRGWGGGSISTEIHSHPGQSLRHGLSPH